MKAIVVEQFKQRLKVKGVAELRLRGPFGALVRIHASGVSHTGLHAADVNREAWRFFAFALPRSWRA